MADDERMVAPLDQLSLCPPTPPQTTSPDSPTLSEALPISSFDIIITELRNRRRGRPQVDLEWWCVSLSLGEFKNLDAYIEADENLYGFKYDYFPQLGRFVLRSPDNLHQVIIGQFASQILRQLFVMEQANDQLVADFARKITPRGSPKVIGEEQQCHSPDSSFAHDDGRELGVILEVSCSQKRKYLPFLADDYILGSKGLTQAVIGIYLESQENKGMEAKVMMWRPRYIQVADGTRILEAAQTLEGIFRAEDGSLVNGERILRIGLKDFGNKYDCPGIDDISGEVTISFSQLYGMVQRGEAIMQTVERGLENRKRLWAAKRGSRPAAQ